VAVRAGESRARGAGRRCRRMAVPRGGSFVVVVGRVFPAVRDVPPYWAWLCGSRGRSPSSTQGRAWMSTGGRVSPRAETLSQKGEKYGRSKSTAAQASGASLLPLTSYLLPICARISRLPAQRPSASPLQDRSRRSHPVIGWSSRARLRCGSRRGCRRVQGAAPFDP